MDPDEQLEKSLKFQTISYLELTFSSNGDFYIKIQNIFDHPDNIEIHYFKKHMQTHNIESCIVPLDHLSNPSPFIKFTHSLKVWCVNVQNFSILHIHIYAYTQRETYSLFCILEKYIGGILFCMSAHVFQFYSLA